MRHIPQRSIVAELFDGTWHQSKQPKAPEKANFVICCSYGDWSGFRTYPECQAQFAEIARDNARPGLYFWVEER